MNYLQPYKGKDTRHDCPSCKAKLSFTQYLDGNTHKPIHDIVGKCNRESKCGYHYTPKQYFIDNPSCVETWHATSNILNTTKQITPPCPIGTIPFHFVQRSASYRSNFVRFLCEVLTDEQIHSIGENYALGATKNKEVIFWQIDINGKVRTGKIMQYNPVTGRRLKHQSGAIDWVHNKLKKSGSLPEDFNLQQCFFGEHLLKIYPDKQVAIVESEKSALIASAVFPNLIWLAAGNLNGLSIEKCQILKGRNVTLFPDLGGYEKWSIKVNEIKQSVNCEIKVSEILEDIATEVQRFEGLDIADYMIEELKSTLSKSNNTNFPLTLERVSTGQERSRGAGGEVSQIQSRFTPELEQMIETNPAVLLLIDRLQLEEV